MDRKRAALNGDFLQRISFSKKGERVGMFRAVPVNERGALLFNLSDRVRESILERLTDEEEAALLHYVDPNAAAKILRHLGERRRERIIARLNHDAREKVRMVLKFRPGTAASLMDLHYLLMDAAEDFRSVAARVREYEKEQGRTPAVLVTRDGFFFGELPLYLLATAPPSGKIGDFAQRTPWVKYDARDNYVMRVFRENPHSKIAVLDHDRSVLGVIYSDDLLQLFERARSESFYGFAGVQTGDDVFGSVGARVKSRYVWLILNLGTTFLAASAVGAFSNTIERFVLLAAYMPVVSGMGGNAAMQTFAVMVRGLATHTVNFSAILRVIWREICAGFVNGLITGGLAAAVAWIFNDSPVLGLVALTAVLANLVIAGVFGSLVPFLMWRLGRDPATSASIIITTATDVFGFLVFLGLAELILV